MNIVSFNLIGSNRIKQLDLTVSLIPHLTLKLYGSYLERVEKKDSDPSN
jgi:hypothetical protein